MRLGIFGGSFNPIHIGHLLIGCAAAEAFQLDRVLLLPCSVSPFKVGATDLAPGPDRLEMVRRSVAGDPLFEASDLDLTRGGVSYTVESVRALHARYPEARLFFIIGGDSLRDLPGWSRPDELIRLVRLGVMRRPGSAPDLTQLEREIPGIRERVDWIDAPQIEISASALAQRVRAGLSIRYQTPDAVRAYIEEHRLYHTNVKTVTEP